MTKPFTAKAPVKKAVGNIGPAKSTNKEIRAWAIADGREVSARGRIPAEIVQAFHDAQAKKAQVKTAPVTKTSAKKTVAAAASVKRGSGEQGSGEEDGREEGSGRFVSGRSGRVMRCPRAARFRSRSSEPSTMIRQRCRSLELRPCPDAQCDHPAAKAMACGVVGVVVGLVAVVFAACTSRPYTVATSFEPAVTDPWIVVVVVLGGATVVGGRLVLWLSGWRIVRDAASAAERRRRRTFLLGRTVAAALGAVTVGLLPMLVLLYAVFTATVGIAVEWAVVVVLYAGSAVLAYGCTHCLVW